MVSSPYTSTSSNVPSADGESAGVLDLEGVDPTIVLVGVCDVVGVQVDPHVACGCEEIGKGTWSAGDIEYAWFSPEPKWLRMVLLMLKLTLEQTAAKEIGVSSGSRVLQ